MEPGSWHAGNRGGVPQPLQGGADRTGHVPDSSVSLRRAQRPEEGIGHGGRTVAMGQPLRSVPKLPSDSTRKVANSETGKLD